MENYNSIFQTYVKGNDIGVHITGRKNMLFNTTVWKHQEQGILIEGDDNRLYGGSSYANSQNYSGAYSEIEVVSSVYHGIIRDFYLNCGNQSSYGIDSQGNRLILENNKIFNPVTAEVNDVGNLNSYNKTTGGHGYNTESGVIAIDSTGRKTVTINHGLSLPPNVINYYITGESNTDWYGYTIGIKSIDDTTFTVIYYIQSASGTSDATADLYWEAYKTGGPS